MRFSFCLFVLLALSSATCEEYSTSSHPRDPYLSLARQTRTLFAAPGPDVSDGPASEPAMADGCLVAVDDGFEIDMGEEEVDDGCTSVVDVAVDNELSTLTAAVNAAQLVDTLGPEFMGTVFAPTEEAFADLLEDLELTADELLENTDLLTQVLLLHVIPDTAAFAEDLENGQELPTAAEDTSVTVSIRRGRVFITAPSGVRAQVIIPDVEATCGAVVHVINRVLTPEG